MMPSEKRVDLATARLRAPPGMKKRGKRKSNERVMRKLILRFCSMGILIN